ncbi:MAG: HAMP domain-containing histidine kinase [Erysipelothrix sp.]|nr:HAMP domain-containing histidine kinase [Erysipelothrix sp.]
MTSNHLKKLVIFHVFVLIGSLIVTNVGIRIVQDQYRSEYIYAKKQLLLNVIEVEEINDDNIIEIVTSYEYDPEKVEAMLAAMNFETVEEFRNFVQLNDTNKLMSTMSYFIIVMINLILFVFTMYKYLRDRHRLLEITKYLVSVQNNDFSMEIKEYDDSPIALIKNEIFKITNKLQTLNEYSIFEKKNLEKTLSDISHQLKTPLTSLFIINSVLEDTTDENLKKEYLKKNQQQLEKIEWLVQSLLRMSQIDSGTIIFQKEDLKVLDLIEAASSDHLIPMELKDIHLDINCDSSLQLSGDKRWTVEALSNIIKNAIEHTPVGGKIKISAFANSFRTAIVVEDNGVGIAESEIGNIFKRFYRKKKDGEGIGIGLNLSKMIMTSQNGDIRVSSTLNVGTEFTFIFNK